MTTNYVLTALPHSVDANDPFHVSVVVSPRLSPSGTLADFPIFADWTGQLAAATLTVVDHTGVPFTIDRLPIVDPARWSTVFPTDTPVTSFVPQTMAGRDWFSYPASKMDLLAKGVHLLSMVADPIDSPLPSASPLAVAIDRLASQLWRDRDSHRGELGPPDEERLTRTLDALINSAEPPDDALMAMFVDLHRVRRFYERPESAQQYRERPDPNAVNERPERLDPDFHQRVALLGDHGALLRELGLVVDVRVSELARLSQARWLTARIVLADGNDPTIPTRVTCQLADGVFTTRARTSDWRGGRMRLGDATRFNVMDLDPDASGLKLERFLVGVPRFADIERNGDPSSAAPATLRAHGFSVARNARVPDLVNHLAAHQTRANALGTPNPPLLDTEDVNKGMRVEVWDDTSKRWYSLHLRSNELELGTGTTFDVELEEGFLQGAAASETPKNKVAPGTTPKTYLAETMFGWSGWSLSAPHPARRPAFRYEGGTGSGAERTETLDEPPPPPIQPGEVRSHPKVAPATLPRLRYGHSYAMRAWGVDLADNSAPRHDAIGLPADAPASPDADSGRGAASVAVKAKYPGTYLDPAAVEAELANRPTPPRPYDSLVQLVRGEAARLAVATIVQPPVDLNEIADTVLAAAAGLFVDETDRVPLRTLLAALVDEGRRRTVISVASGRSERVRRAMRSALDDDALLVGVHQWSAAGLAAIAAAAGGPSLAADTVSPLRPLYRWHPIEPPAVVPRFAFSEGESVRVMVIRSGVDVVNDPELGDTLTVVDPPTYAARVLTAGITYQPISERHIAPPKSNVPEAEMHGKFDTAIGSGDPVKQRSAVLSARRESGTFFDRSIPSLTDPTTPIDVGYLSLEAGPDADPLTLVDLDTLQLGDPIGPGQYLVADTEQLILPYLPDPMATGVSLRFPDAGRDRPRINLPGGVEGVVARLEGEWPERKPYRLVVSGGSEARGDVTGTEIEIALPPGELIRARLASACDVESMKLFGLWNLLPSFLRDDPDIEQAAADGWLWAFSPSDEIRFVHAVQRPLAAPRAMKVLTLRSKGSTAVALFGGIDVHAPTTVRLDAEATWTEWIDDPVADAPEQRTFRANAFSTDVGETERMVFLGGVDATLPLPSEGTVRFHASRHEFGDTKHRLVDYRFRATSRFTEYFHPSLVATPEDRSVVGPVLRVSVPSSARPPEPTIHDIVPLFRWDERDEPEQPFARRRSRRSGVRIYLDRTWFASGDGEQLAVICAPTANDAALDRKVSQWGADPVWRQQGPAVRPMLLEFDHLLHQSGFDDRDQSGYPVGPSRQLPLVDAEGRPTVTVLGYTPEYDRVRKLHYVDVAIDPGSAFWPFVRLVVARYQPDSLDGLHLSPTVRLDYAQVMPARTATLSRVAADRAHVVVSGPVGHRGIRTPTTADVKAAIDSTRKLVARLERRHPTITTDLGWVATDSVRLELGGFDDATWTAAWEASIPLPAGLPFDRPGSSNEWRVTVEEFELFDSDRPEPFTFVPEPRVIYADHLAV